MNPNAREFVPVGWNLSAPAFVPRSVTIASVAPASAPNTTTPTPAPAPAPAPAPTPVEAPAPVDRTPSPTPTPTPTPVPTTTTTTTTAPVQTPITTTKPQEPPKKQGPTEEIFSFGEDDFEDDDDDEEGEGRGVLSEEGIEVEDTREHLNLIFIGHVDAGKSTISGNILYLTGKVDKRTIEKYEREAKEKNRGNWFLAYIMDTNEEERARGKTVEVGRAHFSTEKKRYTILDAPGHKNYVPNMLLGAAQADVGILVISSKTGEFESGFEKQGQTREHAILAKTVGIKQLIVAVNKMDEPFNNEKWSKGRYDEIVTKLTSFLRKDCGYLPKDLIFVPLAGFTGVNLRENVTKDVCPWYDGKSLMQVLDELKPPERNEAAPFRLPVLDKFKDMGCLHIYGKIEAGTVTKGQTLVLMPNKQQFKVLGVFLDETPVLKARPGENVRIMTQTVEEGDVSPGFVVCDTTTLVPVVSEFIAQLVILELLGSNPVFTAGYEAVIHIHTAVRECVVIELVSEIDKKTKLPSKKKPRFVKTGAIVNAKLQVAQPVCLELFESYSQLGRFTLRDKGKTIAIGKVIKV